MTITHRSLEANGIVLHVAEAGHGPLVVLLHGFPELWYAWRYQLEPLSAAGYHVVAPDQRGYGGSTSPPDVDQFTLLHLVGDIVGLIRTLGTGRCVVVGHDWGSQVAANLALWRPDLVRGVALLSVPYRQRGGNDMATMMREALGNRNYVEFFQEQGVAEAVLDIDPRAALRSILIDGSADAPEPFTGADVQTGAELVSSGTRMALPSWLTEQDLDVLGAAFTRSGFRGGLNWYRNSRRNWELMAPWHGAPLTVPSLFACGSQDQVYRRPGMPESIEQLRSTTMPGLRRSVVLDACGHWIQQERADVVTGLLLDFFADLPP